MSDISHTHYHAIRAWRYYLIITHPYTSRSLMWVLTLRFSGLNVVCTFCFFHTCCVFCLSHPLLLDHSNGIWQMVQIIRLAIMQFSHPPISSSCLGNSVLFNTLLSNILNPYSSQKVKDRLVPFETFFNSVSYAAIYMQLCLVIPARWYPQQIVVS